MKILAIETSTLAGSAALLDGEQLVGEYTLNVRTTHSERLLTAVDRLLQDAGWTPATLEGLAVSIGPGSFTGLRIGVSTVKGLAFSLGIPAAAVSTLEALAWQLPFARHPVCPVLDARKGEVYAALFRWEDAGLVRDWEDQALAPDDLCARLSGPTIFVGDGITSYGTLFGERLGARAIFAPAARRLPSAACVGQLGLARLRTGEGVDPVALAPRYLRPSEAELKRRRAVSVH
ncbi:MAG: tRNA (adenosine(37)-N6)-threonylcarbamoyltransferase complex dimerization subunit type 1 TsaB [Candidatus Rokubacteria bacterium]|nr:tRNA (adenosine(37)-N6)-threonylcarbamoyltransferase complex dimerization subunit type 1 TsaB [Candidatus Rokubacteria bacterium]